MAKGMRMVVATRLCRRRHICVVPSLEQLFGLHSDDELRLVSKTPGLSAFQFQTILSPVGRWTYFQRPFSCRIAAEARRCQ